MYFIRTLERVVALGVYVRTERGGRRASSSVMLGELCETESERERERCGSNEACAFLVPGDSTELSLFLFLSRANVGSRAAHDHPLSTSRFILVSEKFPVMSFVGRFPPAATSSSSSSSSSSLSIANSRSPRSFDARFLSSSNHPRAAWNGKVKCESFTRYPQGSPTFLEKAIRTQFPVFRRPRPYKLSLSLSLSLFLSFKSFLYSFAEFRNRPNSIFFFSKKLVF